MRRMLLIAQREFLSYVATWGFWISLAFIPVLITLLMVGLPLLMQRAQPERVFAVISDDARAVQAIDEELERRVISATGSALTGLVRAQAGPEAADTVREALDAGATPQEAARQAGLDPAMVDQAQSGVRQRYVRVPAPAQTAEGVRPYLTGARPTPGADGPLYAAIFISPDGEDGYELDYWSADLTNQDLRNAAVLAIGRLMRNEALREAGVDPATVREAEALRPVVRELSPEKAEGAEEVELADRLPFIIGIAAGYVLFSMIFSVANMLLTSTIEEKSNKVLEVLLSSARLPEILAGKLLGVAGVSLTLMGSWIMAGAIVMGLAAAGGGPLPADLIGDILGGVLRPGFLIPFLFYFAAGYLLFGAVFLALGSLCETMQEAQTLMSPMIFVLMSPIVFLIIASNTLDSPIVAGASWVPLFTPFLMMARLPLDPPLWEIAGTSLVLAASLGGVIWLGARVFRAGALGQARPGQLKKAFAKT